MRVRRRSARAAAAAALITFCLAITAACTSTSATGSSIPTGGSAISTSAPTRSTATTPTTPSTPPLSATSPIPIGTSNDLKNNSAHHGVAVDGEKFLLKVDYWTSVDSSTWNATDNKDVHLLAYLDPIAGAKAPEVALDEFDSAVTLVAANPGLDGVVLGDAQDRAPASIPGLVITSAISYGTQFSVDGISAELADRWRQLAGAQPLSEAALQRAGVYAVDVTVTYRLLVRNAGDSGWHRRTAVDQLTVPVKLVRPAAAATG